MKQARERHPSFLDLWVVLIIAAGIAAPSSAQSTAPKTPSERRFPNVIMIVTDDQPKLTISAYRNRTVPPSERFIVTPALDALAAGGVLFTHCFATMPLCLPSRATLLTGRYPASHGVLENADRLPDAAVTIAEVLQQHGYATAAVGKNAYSTSPGNLYAPSQGFEFTFDPGNDNHLVEYPEDTVPQIGMDSWAMFLGSRADHRDFRALSKSLGFLEDCHTKQKPFFLWLALHATHNPIAPFSPFEDSFQPLTRNITLPPADLLLNKPAHQRQLQVTNWWPFGSQEWRTFQAKKFGDSAGMDLGIADLVTWLTFRGILDNTLIVFVCDQGSYSGEHGMIGKAPQTFYQPFVEIGLIMHWPARFATGSVHEGLIEQVDVMPTILELLGFKSPPQVQGFGLAEELGGGTPRNAYAWIESRGFFAVFDGRFKLTQGRQNVNLEFYDLQSDPDELVNQLGNPIFVNEVARLGAALVNYRQGHYKR